MDGGCTFISFRQCHSGKMRAKTNKLGSRSPTHRLPNRNNAIEEFERGGAHAGSFKATHLSSFDVYSNKKKLCRFYS